MSSDDPPFKERKPLKGQNWVSGNAAAVGRWPDPHGLPSVIGEIDRTAGNQAEFARNARATSPAEKALCKAIVAERGYGPSEHPWKEAEAILDPVNRRLKSGGHEPVLVGVIYHRLKNSHLLKERA